MVATPLLALFTDIKTAILLTLIPTLLVNIVTIASEGHFLQALRRHLPLAMFAMLGTLIGTEILIATHSDFFKLLLALAILLYLFADRIEFRLAWVNEFPRVSKGVFGIGAGLLGGLTNVMAPVLIIYSLESRHSKSDLIQAANLCFLVGKIVQLVTFTIHGEITSRELSVSLLMLIAVSIALFVGLQIRKKIDVNAHRNLLKGLLLILAMVLCLQTAL